MTPLYIYSVQQFTICSPLRYFYKFTPLNRDFPYSLQNLHIFWVSVTYDTQNHTFPRFLSHIHPKSTICHITISINSLYNTGF